MGIHFLGIFVHGTTHITLDKYRKFSLDQSGDVAWIGTSLWIVAWLALIKVPYCMYVCTQRQVQPCVQCRATLSVSAINHKSILNVYEGRR